LLTFETAPFFCERTVYILVFENRAVHATMWKNILEAGRPQTTIWCMHFVCWIPKSTNTHTVYVILIAFQLQRTSLNY